MKLYLRLCFEFFKSPVLLRKFYICPMFFMIEWFLMVSILLFKCTLAGSIVWFSMINSNIWCNFCFVYYARILALVGKGAIRFIYTITVYCLCSVFRFYFFIVHTDNWFDICHAATTYYHNIFGEYFIFMVVWKMFLN